MVEVFDGFLHGGGMIDAVGDLGSSEERDFWAGGCFAEGDIPQSVSAAFYPFEDKVSLVVYLAGGFGEGYFAPCLAQLDDGNEGMIFHSWHDVTCSCLHREAWPIDFSCV